MLAFAPIAASALADDASKVELNSAALSLSATVTASAGIRSFNSASVSIAATTTPSAFRTVSVSGAASGSATASAFGEVIPLIEATVSCDAAVSATVFKTAGGQVQVNAEASPISAAFVTYGAAAVLLPQASLSVAYNRARGVDVQATTQATASGSANVTAAASASPEASATSVASANFIASAALALQPSLVANCNYRRVLSSGSTIACAIAISPSARYKWESPADETSVWTDAPAASGIWTEAA